MSICFKKIALSGGGIKGILHVGALQELSKYQKLDFPDGIYGSSIGAVVATYIAFGLPLNDKLVKLISEKFYVENVVPTLGFKDLSFAFSQKGLFTMDLLEKSLCDIFEEFEIDIKSKRIKDSKMPLKIIASNITKGVPTIFTGDVFVIDALKCSCCMPGVFRPQELYGQIYVDGDIFTPCIGAIEKDILEFSLKTHLPDKITPSSLESLNVLSYFRQIFNMAYTNFVKTQKSEWCVSLSYPGLMVNSNLEEFDLENVLKMSGNTLRSFLLSKGFLQELPKISDAGSSNHLE
jgi:NTE family protein